MTTYWVGPQQKSPLNVWVTCSCGKRIQQTRRQNALARAAKLRRAIREHLDMHDAVAKAGHS